MKDIFLGIIGLLAGYNDAPLIIDTPQKNCELHIACGVSSYRECIDVATLLIKQGPSSGCKIDRIKAHDSLVMLSAYSLFYGHWESGNKVTARISQSTACMSFQPHQSVEIILNNNAQLIYFGNPRNITIQNDGTCTVRKGNLFDWYRS